MLVSFFLRLLWRRTDYSTVGTGTGEQYFFHKAKEKGIVQYTEIAIPMPSTILFKFGKETEFHKFLKKFGFATEIQTGDQKFDEMVYITCDHPVLAMKISRDPIAREQIISALSDNVLLIWNDGSKFWMRVRGDIDEKSWIKTLKTVAIRFGNLRSRYSDESFKRVIIAEAVAFSVLTYAMLSMVEFYFNETQRYINGVYLLIPGIFVGGIAGILLALFFRAILGKSSRISGLVIEIAAILITCLPIIGTQIVSDINRGFNKENDIIIVNKTITDKFIIRGRKSISHFLSLEYAGNEDHIYIPTDLKVDTFAYYRAEVGKQVTLTICKGALGFPWIENVDPN